MKNKYDDALREAFLKSAVIEAVEREMAEFEAMDDFDFPEPTAKQQKEIKRAIARIGKKSSGFKVFKRVAAMIAVVISLTFALVMTQPAVRASVVDTVISFFEKYVLVAFSNKEPKVNYVIGDYTITYIPEGYYLTTEQDTPFKCVKSFGNGSKIFDIYWYNSPFNKTGADEKTTIIKDVSIGAYNGYYVYYTEEDTSMLSWGDETHTFTVWGNISEKEIIKISKNIK